MAPARPGRIPWRDLLAWAEVHGMTRDEFDFLDRCVCAMDDSFCKWHAEKARLAAGS